MYIYTYTHTHTHTHIYTSLALTCADLVVKLVAVVLDGVLDSVVDGDDQLALESQLVPLHNEHGNDFVLYSAVEPDSLIAFFRHFLAFLSFGCL